MLIDLVRDYATCRLSEHCQTSIKKKAGTKPKQVRQFIPLLNMVGEKNPTHCIHFRAGQCALCCKLGLSAVKAGVTPGLKRPEQSLGTCFHCIGNYWGI